MAQPSSAATAHHLETIKKLEIDIDGMSPHVVKFSDGLIKNKQRKLVAKVFSAGFSPVYWKLWVTWEKYLCV